MSNVGRPTKYTDELIKKAQGYITDYALTGDVIPSIVGLASYLNISRSTLYKWGEENTLFSDILDTIQEQQENVLINSGLKGDFNSAITKLVLGKHGYHDKQDVESNVSISIGAEFEGI